MLQNINLYIQSNTTSGVYILFIYLFILHITKKGKLMDTLEKFHIYDKTKKNNQINDKNTVQENIIFDRIIQANSGREHPIHQTPVLDIS